MTESLVRQSSVKRGATMLLLFRTGWVLILLRCHLQTEIVLWALKLPWWHFSLKSWASSSTVSLPPVVFFVLFCFYFYFPLACFVKLHSSTALWLVKLSQGSAVQKRWSLTAKPLGCRRSFLPSVPVQWWPL